jgi:hypothetical protein
LSRGEICDDKGKRQQKATNNETSHNKNP